MGYIPVSDVTFIRIVRNDDGTYIIDGANIVGEYTEEVWDSWNNAPIVDLATAQKAAKGFADDYKLNVPVIVSDDSDWG
jgi:hypothetical protein